MLGRQGRVDRSDPWGCVALAQLKTSMDPQWARFLSLGPSLSPLYAAERTSSGVGAR